MTSQQANQVIADWMAWNFDMVGNLWNNYCFDKSITYPTESLDTCRLVLLKMAEEKQLMRKYLDIVGDLCWQAIPEDTDGIQFCTRCEGWIYDPSRGFSASVIATAIAEAIQQEGKSE